MSSSRALIFYCSRSVSSPSAVPPGRWPAAVAAVLAGQALIVLLAVGGFLLLSPTTMSVLRGARCICGRRARHPGRHEPGVALASGVVLRIRRDERWWGRRADVARLGFAGAHVVAALLGFLLTVSIGELWVIALLGSAAGLIRRRGRIAELAVLSTAIFAGHAALHRVIDQGQALADAGTVHARSFPLYRHHRVGAADRVRRHSGHDPVGGGRRPVPVAGPPRQDRNSMSRQEVRSPGRSGSGRERTSILLLAALIVGGIGIYLALRVSGSGNDTQKDLLPYQVLVRTLPEAEQQTFGAIRRGLADAEAERGRSARWPEPAVLASRGIAPFAEDASRLHWQQFQQGKTVNYIGIPSDPASPAWLLVLQEPEPNMPPDPRPARRRTPSSSRWHDDARVRVDASVWRARHARFHGAAAKPRVDPGISSAS